MSPTIRKHYIMLYCYRVKTSEYYMLYLCHYIIIG